MLRPFKLSLVTIAATILFIAGGELLTGTSVLFVLPMAIALLCIGITYNLLNGISTFSGILFAAFALRTIVISQFGKVFLWEAADKNIEVPLLTISVYAVFYLFLMLGVFVYGRMRISDLPKPLEPSNEGQSSILYIISLVVGFAANILYQLNTELGTSVQDYGTQRSLGHIFSALLFFSIVLAVDTRIRRTNGEHSFGLTAFVPWFLISIFSFNMSSRGGILAPTLVYIVTCYLRGYRFKRRHYAVFLMGLVVLYVFISPFELYSRAFLQYLPFRERTYETFYLMATIPGHVEQILTTQEEAQTEQYRSEYFSHRGTFILSRLSIIRDDSDLIGACANGYHYGWAGIKNDLLYNTPRFLYKGKPSEDSAAFTGRVSGLNPDEVENNESDFSPIADAYGGFGFVGVIALGFCFFPLMYLVFDSIFLLDWPWGTVALGMLLPTFGEGEVGFYITYLIRDPIYLVLLSYLVVGISSFIPTRGDRPWDFNRDIE